MAGKEELEKDIQTLSAALNIDTTLAQQIVALYGPNPTQEQLEEFVNAQQSPAENQQATDNPADKTDQESPADEIHELISTYGAEVAQMIMSKLGPKATKEQIKAFLNANPEAKERAKEDLSISTQEEVIGDQQAKGTPADGTGLGQDLDDYKILVAEEDYGKVFMREVHHKTDGKPMITRYFSYERADMTVRFNLKDAQLMLRAALKTGNHINIEKASDEQKELLHAAVHLHNEALKDKGIDELVTITDYNHKTFDPENIKNEDVYNQYAQAENEIYEEEEKITKDGLIYEKDSDIEEEDIWELYDEDAHANIPEDAIHEDEYGKKWVLKDEAALKATLDEAPEPKKKHGWKAKLGFGLVAGTLLAGGAIAAHNAWDHEHVSLVDDLKDIFGIDQATELTLAIEKIKQAETDTAYWQTHLEENQKILDDKDSRIGQKLMAKDAIKTANKWIKVNGEIIETESENIESIKAQKEAQKNLKNLDLPAEKIKQAEKNLKFWQDHLVENQETLDDKDSRIGQKLMAKDAIKIANKWIDVNNKILDAEKAKDGLSDMERRVSDIQKNLNEQQQAMEEAKVKNLKAPVEHKKADTDKKQSDDSKYDGDIDPHIEHLEKMKELKASAELTEKIKNKLQAQKDTLENLKKEVADLKKESTKTRTVADITSDIKEIKQHKQFVEKYKTVLEKAVDAAEKAQDVEGFEKASFSLAKIQEMQQDTDTSLADCQKELKKVEIQKTSKQLKAAKEELKQWDKTVAESKGKHSGADIINKNIRDGIQKTIEQETAKLQQQNKQLDHLEYPEKAEEMKKAAQLEEERIEREKAQGTRLDTELKAKGDLKKDFGKQVEPTNKPTVDENTNDGLTDTERRISKMQRSITDTEAKMEAAQKNQEEIKAKGLFKTATDKQYLNEFKKAEAKYMKQLERERIELEKAQGIRPDIELKAKGDLKKEFKKQVETKEELDEQMRLTAKDVASVDPAELNAYLNLNKDVEKQDKQPSKKIKSSNSKQNTQEINADDYKNYDYDMLSSGEREAFRKNINERLVKAFTSISETKDSTEIKSHEADIIKTVIDNLFARNPDARELSNIDKDTDTDDPDNSGKTRKLLRCSEVKRDSAGNIVGLTIAQVYPDTFKGLQKSAPYMEEDKASRDNLVEEKFYVKITKNTKGDYTITPALDDNDVGTFYEKKEAPKKPVSHNGKLTP